MELVNDEPHLVVADFVRVSPDEDVEDSSLYQQVNLLFFMTSSECILSIGIVTFSC